MENIKTNSVSIETSGIVSKLKGSYVIVLLSVLGVAALITATLVAWPAIAYFASVLFV